jgi:tetratricopeptide (TPR) repeat protein
MLKPKRKITRQELKEDKLVKTTLQIKNYFEEHNQQLFYILAGLLIIILLIMWYRHSNQKTSQEASAQLGIAQIEFTNANYENATNRLQNLIKDYSGTDEAKQGLFLLANIYYQYRDYTKARDYFKQFVDSYSGSNILLASGYAGLAACHETEHNFTEAGKLYEQAAKIAGDFIEADDYAYLAGICFKKAGEIDQAKKQFKKLVDESKPGQRTKDAETQLLALQ